MPRRITRPGRGDGGVRARMSSPAKGAFCSPCSRAKRKAFCGCAGSRYAVSDALPLAASERTAWQGLWPSWEDATRRQASTEGNWTNQDRHRRAVRGRPQVPYQPTGLDKGKGHHQGKKRVCGGGSRRRRPGMTAREGGVSIAARRAPGDGFPRRGCDRCQIPNNLTIIEVFSLSGNPGRCSVQAGKELSENYGKNKSPGLPGF